MGLSKAEIEWRGHPVWAEVDLGAIRHNVRVLQSLAPSSEVMGVAKGYAYGHGNPVSARALLEGGASCLGVARVAEALHLRESGIDAPIMVFTEPPPTAVGTLVDANLTPAVYTMAFAQALSDAATARNQIMPVHVKLDTGMHRVGISPDETVDAVKQINALEGIEIEGIWSHLAVAEIPDHPFTRKQLDLFVDLIGQIEGAGVHVKYKHIANSAATMSLPESHFDLVRPGVAAYGLWPGEAQVDTADLKPAMSLKSRINMVKTVPAGDALSYGLNYELKQTSKVVTVPTGYADGYDRGFSGLADVLIEGERHRVSGTVCMDQFMVDVGVSPAQIGSIATLLGRDGMEAITAEELAERIGTINYEVTSRIASRVPRLYIDPDDQ